MTKQVQRRRGTSSQHTSFTGAEGEISVNTSNKTVHVHDGSTAGGFEAALASLDNVSVADVSSALSGVDNIDINGGTIDGTTIGGNSAAAITGTTVTGTSFVSSGNMTFGDNDKAIFGAGSDLQIYHQTTGTAGSYISENGTGDLRISGNNLWLNDVSGDTYFRAVNGSYAKLYHAGDEKISTTSTGVDVTGTVTADGLTVDKASSPAITLQETTGTYGYKIHTAISSSTDYGLRLRTLANKELATFNSNGDISFYEDTGTTAKLMWDASDEALEFGDNVKAKFGAGSDLQIYHETSTGNSRIVETGSGHLNIEAANLNLKTPSGENYINCNADGTVLLRYDNEQKLATTSTGVAITGNATFADNGKAIFGAGSDLEIYHNGSNSVIKDSGTGDLSLQSSGTKVGIYDTAGNKPMANFYVGAETELYYNGAEKLATTSTGVDVTGTITSDGLTVDGSVSMGDILQIQSTTGYGSIEMGGPNGAYIDFKSPFSDDFDARIITTDAGLVLSTAGGSSSGISLQFENATKLSTTSTGVDVTGTISSDGLTVEAGIAQLELIDTGVSGSTKLRTANAQTWLEVDPDNLQASSGFATYIDGKHFFNITDGGDISFYEDTGTTAKFFWDASAESLGIGTSSPDRALHISSSSAIICLEDTGGGLNDKRVQLQCDTGQFEINSRNDDNSNRVDNIFVADLGTGNVGIGTDSPTTKLMVEDTGSTSIRVVSTDATDARVKLRAGGNSDINLVGKSNEFYILDGSTERMRIDSSGNVGIGTSSPHGRLTVTQGTNNAPTQIVIENTDSNIETAQEVNNLEFYTNDSSTSGMGVTSKISQYAENPGNQYGLSFSTYDLSLTEAMRIDSSGNVGIGTSSPVAAISVNGEGSQGLSAWFGKDDSFVNNASYHYADARVGISGRDSDGTDRGAGIEFTSRNTGNSNWRHGYLVHDRGGNITFGTGGAGTSAGSEAMRIDSSGNLLVGTTVSNPAGNNSAGVAISSGSYGGFIGVTRDSNTPVEINRKTNDGNLITFRKDGATVGSIAAGAGGFLTIGSPNGTPVYATFANGSLKPTTSLGSNSDGSGDLGNTSSRWKDLYLSGGVYLGGTGSANKLDDYEEGTYTPAFLYGNAIVYSNQTGRYCKVGNLVFVSIDITITSKSSDGSQVHVSLPFLSTHGSASGVSGSVDYYLSSLVPSSRVAWQPSNYGTDSVRFNGQGGLHTYNSLNSSGRLVAGFSYYI